MKIYLLLINILFLIGCQGQSNSHQKPYKEEKYLLNDAENKILELKEVKDKQALISSISNNKRGISLISDSIEINNSLFYEITVGYNSDIRFENYYTFYIKKGNCDTIKILDIISGDIIALSKWRKIQANLENSCIALSKVQLPYKNIIDYKTIVYSILDCKINGMDKWDCAGDFRYIPLIKKDNIDIILVPMDCGDYPYRYYMLTIKDNTVIDNLYVEGEWYEPGEDDRNTIENTSFSVDKNYIISVITKKLKEKTIIQKYKILDSGKFEAVK